MRIAVLADVHGNLPALEAVLDDARRHAVDRIVVNGDLINRGPQGSAVWRRLADLDAERTVGNHDDLLRRLAEDDPGLPDDFRHGRFWRAARWCADELDAVPGWRAEVRSWPLTVAVDEPGAGRVLVAHGSPRHFREGYGPQLADEVISEIVEMHPADVLVGSHTHWPLQRRWGRARVLGTGAVGVPFNGDGRAQYLWLTRSGDDWTPTFRRVAYDRSAALAAFEATGYLEAGGLLARLFRDEVRDARSYLVPFLMWVEGGFGGGGSGGFGLDDVGFEAFRRARPERFRPAEPWPERTASVAP